MAGKYKRISKKLHKSGLNYRYVWELHNGPIPPDHDIHHIDFDKSNDDITNLQLMTSFDHNSLHMKLNNPKKGGNKGENNPMFGKKHSPEAIEKMRQKKLGKQISEETRAKLKERPQCKNRDEKGRFKKLD